MRDKFLFSDAQAHAAEDSTGTISDNIYDLEVDASGGNTILTDDEVVGVLNVEIVATDVVPATDTGAEGIIVELRTDDATSLATAKTATAGYRVLGAIEIPVADLVVGTKVSLGIMGGIVAKKYLGTFLRAVSNSIVGSVTVDIWMSPLPDGSPNEDRQKVPSR